MGFVVEGLGRIVLTGPYECGPKTVFRSHSELVLYVGWAGSSEVCCKTRESKFGIWRLRSLVCAWCCLSAFVPHLKIEKASLESGGSTIFVVRGVACLPQCSSEGREQTRTLRLQDLRHTERRMINCIWCALCIMCLDSQVRLADLSS